MSHMDEEMKQDAQNIDEAVEQDMQNMQEPEEAGVSKTVENYQETEEASSVSSATKKEQRKKIILLCCRLLFTFVTLLFMLYFLKHESFYRGIQNGVMVYRRKRLLAVLGSGAFLLAILHIPNRFSKALNKFMGIVLLVFSPFLTMRVMDYITKAHVYTFEKMLMNLIVLTVILLAFMLITNSYRISAMGLLILGCIFALANLIVYQFRGTPILAADFATVGTAANVASNYVFKINFRMFFAVYVVYGFCVVAMKLKYQKIFSLKPRLVFLLATVCIWALFIRTYFYTDYLEEIYIKLFNPIVSYRRHGTALTFTRSFNYIMVRTPEGYSVKRVEEIAEEYMEPSVKASASGTDKPNVIAIVNESFSDMEDTGDVKVNQDYMPFIRSLKEDTVRGNAFVSIRGGQTANSEFEFLTGNTMAFLPPQSVAFQLYVKHNLPSLTTLLKANGYVGNNAYHPHYASGYNRTKAYPFLGFEHFYSVDDFPNADRIGAYITDKSLYERIITDYEESKKQSEQPFYLYTMTMQNHSPYDRDTTGLDTPIVMDASQYDALQQIYLNLIKESDNAFQYLVEYFKEKEDPTVIVFFGDHQHRKSDKFMEALTKGAYKEWTDEENVRYRYCVPFLIWANYDIEEKEGQEISLNYLSGMVADVAGLDQTPYQRFLADMQQYVPIINANGYFGEDGKFYDIADKDSPYYDWILKYNILQYNNMFDKDNRLDAFFFGEE